jgi:hypothetical protein
LEQWWSDDQQQNTREFLLVKYPRWCNFLHQAVYRHLPWKCYDIPTETRLDRRMTHVFFLFKIEQNQLPNFELITCNNKMY